MARTTQKQLVGITNVLIERLHVLGDPEWNRIALDHCYTGWRLVIHKGHEATDRHSGISTSRFGDAVYPPGQLWQMIHGMLGALRGIDPDNRHE